jgi:DNA-binding NarL/FixJ family response regulator
MATRLIKLLLVEDNEGDAVLLRRLLSRATFLEFGVTHVSYLNTAITAVRHPKSGQFDVVLLDLNLPDSLGVDTVTAMAREVPDVPIVVLSGQEDIKIADMALKCGAYDFVVKKSVVDYAERDLTDELERKVWTAITNHRKYVQSQALMRVGLAKAGAVAATPALVHTLQGHVARLDEGLADMRSYLKLHYPEAWDALGRIFEEKIIEPMRSIRLQLRLEESGSRKTQHISGTMERLALDDIEELGRQSPLPSVSLEEAEADLLAALQLDVVEALEDSDG